jgi:hypothetical protein
MMRMYLKAEVTLPIADEMKTGIVERARGTVMEI